MIINHNLPAMYASRQMGINVWQMDNWAEKLASGQRINRAADDAAGLAVSEKMRAQIRGLNQASRNAQDAISLLQTAEGWLQETTDILQRMGELSVQAANGVYTDSDRMQIQVEIDQLMDEVDRIASHAEFNTLILLSGQFSREAAGVAPQGEGQQAVAGDTGGIVAHIGANMDQRIRVYLDAMDTTALGLTGEQGVSIHGAEPVQNQAVSLRTLEEANKSIATIHTAILKVSEQRANLGAFQNRLEHAVLGIDYAAENLQAAESRIRDTDMAAAMVEYVKYNILTQTSASMLAQANITPQYVLRILR